MFLFPRAGTHPGLHAIGNHTVTAQLQPRTPPNAQVLIVTSIIRLFEKISRPNFKNYFFAIQNFSFFVTLWVQFNSVFGTVCRMRSDLWSTITPKTADYQAQHAQADPLGVLC